MVFENVWGPWQMLTILTTSIASCSLFSAGRLFFMNTTTNLPFQNILKAETLSFKVTSHYPLWWNASQTWNCDITATEVLLQSLTVPPMKVCCYDEKHRFRLFRHRWLYCLLTKTLFPIWWMIGQTRLLPIWCRSSLTPSRSGFVFTTSRSSFLVMRTTGLIASLEREQKKMVRMFFVIEL